MANASPENPHFFQPLLPGFQNHLKIPVKFFNDHIEGKHEGKTVTLRSDASERRWKVNMEGKKLIEGWKEFVETHDLRIGDFVIFRHEGNMLFHVTALGSSCCEIQYTSPHNQNIDETGESSGKENGKTEPAQFSSDLTCFSRSVTASSLTSGRVTVPADFARQNGFNKGRHEILLMNEEGDSWKSEVKSTMSGQVFICQNWRMFCTASKLEVGDSLTFTLLRNTEKPVLQICSCAKPERKKKIMSEEVKIRFVKLTPTPNSLELGKQHLPVHFTRANKLNKPMKITLVDKDNLEWSMKLKAENIGGTMYIMGSNDWKSFCASNEVSAGESLTLELIRGGERPLLKFCSKNIEHPPFKAETRAQKRARLQRRSQEIEQEHDVRQKIAEEGEPSRRTRSSDKFIVDEANLQHTRFCSVSDHVAKVKQSLVDTLTCIGRFQAELKTQEQSLEASLQEINNLERIT